MVPEHRVKTCTYQVCQMVPEQRVRPAPTRCARWCPSTREDLHLPGLQDGARAACEDCTYQVCKMVPENRVKTCTYQVCRMVPEQRVKPCTYQVCKMCRNGGSRLRTYQVCKMVPEQRVRTCSYRVCRLVQEQCVRQVALHRAETGGMHQDHLVYQDGPEDRDLHGDAAGPAAGDGMRHGLHSHRSVLSEREAGYRTVLQGVTRASRRCLGVL